MYIDTDNKYIQSTDLLPHWSYFLSPNISLILIGREKLNLGASVAMVFPKTGPRGIVPQGIIRVTVTGTPTEKN